MEQQIRFMSAEFALAGLFQQNDRSRAVIVTHPHPLYGGDMHNPVVETIVCSCQQLGYTTLRFNFRGVGESEGRYGQGMAERQDVVAAITHLNQLGFQTLTLAGYSFGAWVNAGVECRFISRMITVSPPVAFLDYAPIGAIPCLDLVIAGSDDDIGPPESVRRQLSIWNPAAVFEIIPHADHFYSGRLAQLEDILMARIG